LPVKFIFGTVFVTVSVILAVFGNDYSKPENCDCYKENDESSNILLANVF
jgi:hypothetical protein